MYSVQAQVQNTTNLFPITIVNHERKICVFISLHFKLRPFKVRAYYLNHIEA